MRKIHIYAVLLLLIFTACEETYLDRFPKDQLTVETTFTTNSNFETYVWGFYSWFGGYNLGQQNADLNGDLMIKSSGSLGQSWLWEREIIPSSSGNWTTPYYRIKRVNLMLDNIEGSQLTEDQQKHWKSVGYFFRAYSYFSLLSKYGGVPWIDRVLSDSDEDILYGPRNSRDEIAGHILADLQYAVENIDPAGNGANTVNVHVVRALLSRFGLFEGTWRKYHGLGDETKYLQASLEASAALATSFPSLISNYDLVFNSESLAGKPGIILYKEYDGAELSQVLTSRMRNSSGNWDLTRAAMDLYLCKDGQSRWTSPMFDGDQNIYDEFRNRDNRMYYTTVPPYKIVRVGGNNTFNWEHTGIAEEREYIDLMETLTDDQHKSLPDKNWRGFVVSEIPHFRKFNRGQGYNVTYSGYKLFKYFNQLNTGIQNKDFADAPIFRMGEVLVNYAEAAFELGSFDQSIADLTINNLRVRGGVDPLNLATMVEDPSRDTSVDPILWEIRRERAVELMAEGFRFNDLRRWRKVNDYAGEEKLGAWINNADYNNKIPIQGGASEGYVSPYGVPPGFPDYYYLYPIPTEQIVLNSQLEQNPGWE
ncbi:RagB/SusD family nutrient uptake outer membrane protein [Puteibacter caeruleilacunae]|nr:RagB/SusD family nutrient uptake outer membrane protein [Puteibacter caeruleilacunae]